MMTKLVENPAYVMYKDDGSAGFRYIVFRKCSYPSGERSFLQEVARGWNRTKRLNGYFF